MTETEVVFTDDPTDISAFDNDVNPIEVNVNNSSLSILTSAVDDYYQYDEALICFPNPTNGQINFDLSDIYDTQIQLRFFNSQGELLFDQILTSDRSTHKISLPLEEIQVPPGLIFYTIETRSKTHTGSFIYLK